jgi:hypothetical protein
MQGFSALLRAPGVCFILSWCPRGGTIAQDAAGVALLGGFESTLRIKRNHSNYALSNMALRQPP